MPACLITGEVCVKDIKQGMTDEFHVHTRLLIERYLEGQDDRHLIYPFGDLLDASGTPRPDLRAHVIQDGHGVILEGPCQSQIEAGIIDQHR